MPNFRDVDWDEFAKALERHLKDLQPEMQIEMQEQLNSCCKKLTEAIQWTISVQVPHMEPTPKSKRWWTKELMLLRKRANKLGRSSHALRGDPEHAVHAEHKEAARLYDKTLQYTKKQHWQDWLERAEEPDLWAAHHLTSAPATDRGKARIPILKYKVEDQECLARSNGEKSLVLARGFFPHKLAEDLSLTGYEYPEPCEVDASITVNQIQRKLRKLKLYKAPGPDGIPNIVLMKCTHLLASRLLHIYKATLDRNLIYEPWKHFTTVVLRKPGKPRYDVPKVYRPIALLNTMWKVLTAIVAEQLTYVMEKHQLLPAHHFGGCPGRTTMDTMHVLAHSIKAAWRSWKVASVLFLDIEGAFPNAMPSCLVHNLRKRQVPGKITNFIHHMLQGWVTVLRYDSFTSDPIPIDNGIGQGDLLSMMIYQYYNADILEVPSEKGEKAIAYVDDSILIATAKMFQEAHKMLESMMCRTGGVADWSKAHNSPLEYSKLAMMDFAHRSKPVDRVPLRLPQGEVQLSENAKYLGVVFDQHLSWKMQYVQAVGKGSKWASQIRRLAGTTWGITPKHARKLYISVALPRILYAADVWCNPPKKGSTGSSKTTKIIKQLISIQRAGALAITGGLRTSPTDTLDAAAFLIPAAQMVDKWCHRALVRLATLPLEHPLYKVMMHKIMPSIKRHKSPIISLLGRYNLDPKKVEKIPMVVRHPKQIGEFPFLISIPNNREDSTEEAKNATEEIQVFTDGSAKDGQVGAAVVLLRAGKTQHTLHLHMGPEEEHMVHKAELVGILLGLHLISTEKQGNMTCMIGVDNQAANRSFLSELRRPGHHLARDALRVATQIQKRRGKGKYALTIR